MTGVFWITSDCNLNCIYCYADSNKKKQFMSTEVVDKSVDFLINIMVQHDDRDLRLVLHGGEPFLAFDVMKYLVASVKEKALKRDINVSFICTTNATVLTEDMLDFITQEIKNITVSMDGKKETQNYTRPFKNGMGTHEIVETRLKELLTVLPQLRVRLTYNHSTCCDLFENVKYLIGLGVKCIVPARDFYDNKFTNTTFDILEKELLKIKEYAKKYTDVKIGLLDTGTFKKYGLCNGGVSSFNFNSDGVIYPCSLTVGNEEFIIGNVFDGINVAKRDELLSYSGLENEECVGCDLYAYCTQTRCKMINKIINGDYCKSSPVECREKNILYNINFIDNK